MNGLTSVPVDSMFTFVAQKHDVNTRGAETLQIALPKSNLNIRKNFFTLRVVQAWNDLPLKLRQKSTLISFKKGLDNFLSV